MMTKKRAEQLITDIVCEGQNKEHMIRHRDFSVTATVYKKEKKIDVEVKQMYEYVDASFSTLKKISEAFGTEEININNWSQSGCETCDWGSCYTVVFNIINPTKE